ncbi:MULTISPECIES: DMT family transporter [Roseomonadaceae]|uniref:DMT family transporter n=1 Tax=Roseomonadaceae TaxID=3385906 RepID=UPI001E47D099|nr:DMT family transporter [Roseomonas oleicola]
MTTPLAQRLDPRGLALLLVTVIGWGFNWPSMKLLLGVLPPFSMRVVCAVLGISLLFAIAAVKGERLAVPRALWPRLVAASLLNVTAWMGMATFSLLWLAAGEATIVCYTMPVWTSLLAWLVLGEPPSRRRLAALALGFCGLVVLVVGPGLDVGLAKLPGVAAALAGAVLFSLGTVVTKRWPLALPPTTSVAWQLLVGCTPLLAGALIFETPDFSGLSGWDWAVMVYGGVGPLGLCYLAWFAALRRLPAAAASSGTLLTPVIGVASAALLLGEPLGLREVAALSLTIGGVILAVRG